MNKNRIVAALAAGAILGTVGAGVVSAPSVAYAEEAGGVDGFSDVPKDHWAYEALDYLAKEGVIEGYGDGTFRGNRTMTRYEMAAIIAKASKSGSLGGDAVLEKMQREFKDELQTMKKQVKQNTEDIQALKKEQERFRFDGFVRAQWDKDTEKGRREITRGKQNGRFYLNLYGHMKINDEWSGHLQSETNHSYTHDQDGMVNIKDDGTIQRIWLEGRLKNGLNIDMGKKWTGLGFHNVLYGATTSGIDASYPITKNGLRLGAFYYANYEWSGADYSFWGPKIFGPVGHNFDINIAFAKVNKGRNTPLNQPWSRNADSWAADWGNYTGSHGFVIGVGTNVAKNLRLSGDYVQTNHRYGDGFEADPGWADKSDSNKSYVVRLDWKGTNLAQKGSFGAYLRYHYIGRNGAIFNDDEWGSRLRNSKGLTVGFKYVPWKNVEWETFFMHGTVNMQEINPNTKYTRRLLRTQFDYHF